MQAFMRGFQNNDSISMLDLTDNELEDEAGLHVLNMIKS